MNASGVRRLLCMDSSGRHARGNIGNLPVAVVWQFPLLKVGDKGAIQLPGSHLFKYLIPGDVPRSSPSSYLRSPLHGAQIPRSELPASAFSAYMPSSCSSSDQGVMPLFVAVKITPFYLTFQTQWLVNVKSGSYFGGWETVSRISNARPCSIYPGAFICLASRPGLKWHQQARSRSKL